MSKSILLITLTSSLKCFAQDNPEKQIGSNINIHKEKINPYMINWPKVEAANISNNGKYAGYITREQNSMKLTLLKTDGTWQIESSIKGSYIFTSNSKMAIWCNSNDSLCISLLGTSNKIYVPNVVMFTINNNYLSYESKTGESKMINSKLTSQKFTPYKTRRKILITYKKRVHIYWDKDSTSQKLILCSNKRADKFKIIWTGSKVRNLIQDRRNQRLAFLAGERSDSLWYYKIGKKTLMHIKLPINSPLILKSLSNFSRNGSRLFINLEAPPEPENKMDLVRIWSYKDDTLLQEKLNNTNQKKYTGIISISNRKYFQFDNLSDLLFIPSIMDSKILVRTPATGSITHDNKSYNLPKFSWHLQSLKSNEIRYLKDINASMFAELSPHGKYVIFYDLDKKNYFTFEVKSHKYQNITQGIQEKWGKSINDNNYGSLIYGWNKNDSKVLIYGEFDIWEIDPTGKQPPINLTNEYGRKNKIKFSIVDPINKTHILGNKETFILGSFDRTTKENGFYKLEKKRRDLSLLSKGAYIYDIGYNPALPNGLNFAPIKANNATKYIVRRMSSNKAPNFFITSDFKSFERISDVHPEKAYNWYSTELHDWQLSDGHRLQGVLYKPENFDSTRKYPIIFYIYEQRSDLLNAFLEPQILDNGCAINIAYYTSNGYLIFCPDILYTIGDPMQGSYDALTSAAKYVSNLPYVNNTKIGIQGCSWGAIQVNYLITHTNIFAAACSASGIANWISGYGSIMRSGASSQEMYESGQFRIGASLWENQSIYIKNTAVLTANKVTTPILLMHTTNDDLCLFSNILEFFTSLRRLGKTSWLLEYKGNHGVFGNDAIDFSLRMKQFFDHYLKKQSAPNWMTQSNSIRSDEDQHQPDTIIKIPGNDINRH